ncbi:MAG: hypothetical protein MZV49_24035 [Rhodopseudomonas palustris]|nr:hypothetical protein [Rhodopseudomonas palustris]
MAEVGGGSGCEAASTGIGRRKDSLRLDTWEGIVAEIRRVGECAAEDERIELLIIVRLRLLGTDSPLSRPARAQGRDGGHTRRDRRDARGRGAGALDRFIYYTREVIKKLPVRQDAEDMIEQIRMGAEAFEESRCEDDPLKGFAGDLRKEVHRRLSAAHYWKLYRALPANFALHGNPEPIMKAGYVALPSRFSRRG